MLANKLGRCLYKNLMKFTTIPKPIRLKFIFNLNKLRNSKKKQKYVIISTNIFPGLYVRSKLIHI